MARDGRSLAEALDSTGTVISLPILGRNVRPRSPHPGERAAPRAVRISITDRCDLACLYCRPGRNDGYFPAEARLGADHWVSLVAGLVARGVTRVRITGGEPLLHPHVVEIVSAVAHMKGVDDVALTTNATRLVELAKPLRDAGLQRINVSIDSLDEGRFSRLTRGGRLRDVLDGIEAARRAGFEEIKTNTVVMGPAPTPIGEQDAHNDDELVTIARWAWSLGATPRFLELMTVGEGAKLRGRLVPYGEMRARLAPLLAEDPPHRPANRGPASYLPAADGSGRRIGFITGASDTFCQGCDRLRATSDGTLRPCLATTDAVDVAEAARAGDLPEIGRRLDEAWAMKPDGVVWKGCTEESASDVNMRSTGG
jgi:cyclic pyranopterin phosphate synthase